MNYSQILKALPALESLKRLNLPYEKAKDIYKLHKALNSEYSFFAEEEKKLIDRYCSKTSDGKPNIQSNGIISFDNADSKSDYLMKINELMEQISDVTVPEIIISANDIGNQTISSETIENLESIINFE